MKQKEERTPSSYRLVSPHATSIPHELIPLLPANWPTEIPLARVTTCGTTTVSITVLHQINSSPDGSPLLVYGPPDAALLAEKGAPTALILLPLLASQPECSATKDWLSETLGHLHNSDEDDDLDERPGLKRVDNVVTHLRHLLFPPILRDLPTAPQLRRRLVIAYRASSESGPGYRLAGLPLLWVDIEAISDHLQRARTLDQFGQDGSSEWQAVHELAGRGVFAAQEPYSDWPSWRRQKVESQLWESVQALWRRVAKQGEAGETEAIQILQDYWRVHVSNEDALRPLIELWGRRECYGQAEEAYAHLCLALEQEGKQPDQRTQETMTFLRALQIQRKQTISKSGRGIENSNDIFTLPPHQPHGFLSSFSKSVKQDRIDAVREPITQSVSLSQEARGEYIESGKSVDRREVTTYIGTLGLAILANPYTLLDPSQRVQSKFTKIDQETLTQFGMLTETCMNLSEGNQLEIAERVLWGYLPAVEAIAQQSSEHQQLAASIASQSYLIAASLVGHHNDLQARQRFSEQALVYGDLAQDYTLQVASLRQLAATFSYLKLPHQVMQTYQRALPSVDKVPPLLRSCIYAALSGVCAQFKQKQDAYHFIGLAYESFGEHHGDEPYFLRAINASQNLLIHWDGKNHLLLGEPHKAEHVLMQLDVLDPKMKLPKRIRVEAINNRARMFIAIRDMEQACMYLEIAVKTAVEIGSRLRLQEVVTTFQSLKSTWPDEARVRELDDLFIQYLVDHLH